MWNAVESLSSFVRLKSEVFVQVQTGRDFFHRYVKSINFIAKFMPSSLLKLFLWVLVDSESRASALFRYLYFKKKILKMDGVVYFGKQLTVKRVERLSLGANVSIHNYCYLDAEGGVSIGNNVSIAHGCSLVSFDHEWSDLSVPIKYNPIKVSAITIRDDVWVGCGVRILAGSYIESRVVVAAGAVVKGRLESGYLYGGIPAKKLRALCNE